MDPKMPTTSDCVRAGFLLVSLGVFLCRFTELMG